MTEALHNLAAVLKDPDLSPREIVEDGQIYHVLHTNPRRFSPPQEPRYDVLTGTNPVADQDTYVLTGTKPTTESGRRTRHNEDPRR